MATCPECDFDEIDTEDFEEGDTLSCPECGKSLVMIGPDEVEFADADDDDDLDDDEDEDELEEDEDDEDDLDEDEEEEDLDE
jgi:alpha-aminoadipate carrier protein LysW